MGEICLADEFILETHGLTKEFAGFFAVRDVSLKVRRGSIHALIGPNGAGKTTCFNLLTKFLSPSAGQILYKGNDITAMAPADVARLGLVRSFQISAVFPHLTALENVRVALQRQHGSSFDFWRSKSVLDRFNGRAHELLNDVGLSEFANTPAVEMPYGRKRALEIATTLALDPEMMLLDEPMAGMGHEDIDKIAALIKRISAKYTILMVEHNLSVVANLSDIITVLTRGQVLAEGNYRQAYRFDPLQRPGHHARLVRQDCTPGHRVLSRGARHFRKPRRARKPAAAADRALWRPVARSDLRIVSEPEGAPQQPGHQAIRWRAADARDRQNPAHRRALSDVGRADRGSGARHHPADRPHHRAAE